MTSISPDLSFLVSYVKGLCANLLTREDFDNLINKDYEVFIHDLKSFEIGEKLKRKPSYQSHEIEKLLTASLLDQYSFILQYSPVWAKEFLESYTTKFEIINIQRISRYLYSKAEVDLIDVINLRPQEMLGRTAFISKLLQCKDFAELIEILKKETDYQKEIEIAENLYSKVGDIWPFEFAVESVFLRKMLEKAKQLKRSEREGAQFFINQEILKNLLLVILKADFVEIDVQEAMQLLPFPKEFPYKRQVAKLLESMNLQSDLEILQTFGSEKINQGIERYKKDKMFLHIEIAIRANELEISQKKFQQDFGILSIMCYLKQYETQIQDLNKLLYLKEYKFPIEKTRELIINVV